MLLTLSTNFSIDSCDATEVVACDAQGRGVMRVRFNFDEFHPMSYDLLDEAGLMHQSIARVILAASDLIDSFFIDEEPVYEIEV